MIHLAGSPMALATKSQQAVECVEQFQRYLAARPLPSAQCQGDPALSRSGFTTPEEVNAVYRRRARFYDWSVNTYYLIGFRWWAYRRRAIAALQLGRGATVVEIGCGTGLNFGLVQQRIGPTGRLFGVDLCADMLDKRASGSQLKAGTTWSSSGPGPRISIFRRVWRPRFPPSHSRWSPGSTK